MVPQPYQQQQQQQQQLQRMANLQPMEHVVLRDVPTGMDALCSTGGGGTMAAVSHLHESSASLPLPTTSTSPWSSAHAPTTVTMTAGTSAYPRTPPHNSPRHPSYMMNTGSMSCSNLPSSLRQPSPVVSYSSAAAGAGIGPRLDPLESAYALEGAEEHLSQEELAQIRQALAESAVSEAPDLIANPPAASTIGLAATAATINADGAHLSEEEASAIQQALQEADRAEELQSLQLAMQMQEEERRVALQLQQTAAARNQRQPQGNVRTMTRAEFEAETYAASTALPAAGTSPGGVGAFYVNEPPRTLHPLEEESGTGIVGASEGSAALAGSSAGAPGFRMNSAAHRAAGQPWARRDQNSVLGPNNEVRTKHDARLDSLANAHRLGLDATDDADGSRGGNDYVNHISTARIGNKAYNSFMQSVNKKQTKKGVATHGTGRAGSDVDATKGGAMDPHVRLQITKAINGGLIDKCNGVIKEGKEALVYHADKGQESGGFDVAIKIFKRIQEFKGRGEYVTGDPRYSRENFKKASAREQLEMWTEKEYRNLIRANRAGVPVPSPLMQKQNILFMRFMGVDGWPAPQLRELNLRPGSAHWSVLYSQVMKAVQKLYKGARLIHGDLSEYNILVVPVFLVENKASHVENEHEEVQAVLIDFGQTVDVQHPDAEQLLERDLERVDRFFKRNGVDTLAVSEAMAFVKDDDVEESTRTTI